MANLCSHERRSGKAKPAFGGERIMRRRLLAVAVLALAAAAILSGPAYAQQVTGLTAEQEDGFTTLAWNTIPGATDYQIERTPVDAANVPTGAAVIAGLWRPNRTITPEFPTFAESGYNPGDRFQWRVRARFGTDPQPFSLPVFGTTLAPWGNPAVPGENLRTQWEQTQAGSFTNDVNEYAYTAALDQASDRVRVVEIGRTLLDRPINMFVIGYPSPPATAAAISSSPTALVNCNVHGNEPSSREACLILARELAFGNDARTIDILSHATVLLVPSINGDGRAANQRGNSTGQDLNRDYSLIRQPETFSFVRMMRDYTPQAAFDGHEFGNNNAGDLPVLPPRHLNVAQSIFDQSMDLIEGSMYVNGSADGWWYCPYGCQGGGAVGLSEETILRNTMGLKSTIGSLLEARSAGGATRPNEGAAANNRRRKTYSALYTYQRFFEYHRANEPEIADSIDESLAFQRSNTGRIVFRGSRPIPPHPAPHPGESPPPEQNPGPELILENPPCGYLLTDAQYNGVRDDSPPGFPTTVAQRVGAHGWAVDTRPAGYIVRLAQAQRGLIPLLLDAQAVEEWVDGQRLFECPHAAVSPASLSVGAVEGTQTTRTLTVSNLAVEPNQNLNWTITEAQADCSSPSNLGWVSTSPASGTTAPSGTSNVTVTFSTAGLTAPAKPSGVLCLRSNDPGEPLIVVPVSLQVQYPFTGFFSPIANPPALNSVNAGASRPVKFSLGGFRGLAIFAAGSRPHARSTARRRCRSARQSRSRPGSASLTASISSTGRRAVPGRARAASSSSR